MKHKYEPGLDVREFIDARPNLTRREKTHLWHVNVMLVIHKGQSLSHIELQAELQAFRNVKSVG